jgi:hypothetical protein
MLRIPGIENSTVREVIWTPEIGPGIEYLRLTERFGEIEADGLVIGTYEFGAFRLRYRIACDTEWKVRRVHLGLIGGVREVKLSTDGKGNWVDSMGLPVAELVSCIDVDISGSPFTNTLPIRRLGLQPGQSADLPMVYVYVPTLQIVRVLQRYTCLEVSSEGGLYRLDDVKSDFTSTFTAVLSVDKNGLVLDYPELFRRAWISEYETVRKGDAPN